MKLTKIIILGFLILSKIPSLAQIAVNEGNDAVYVYLADRRLSAQILMGNLTGVNLYRSIGNEAFKPLRRVQAAGTQEDFKRIAGPGILHDIQIQKGLKSEQEAWEYVRKNPLLNDYGLIILNPDFSVAMGAVYKDEEVKKAAAKNVRYKAEFITVEGKVNKTSEATLTLGLQPAIEKPALENMIEDDSSVIVNWKLKVATSPDAMLGQIWVREKANAPFKKAGYAFANRDEKNENISFTWQQSVKPGLSYGLYIVPQTLVNLPGPASDTLSLISRNFRNLAQIPIAAVRDTINGIFISWKTIGDLSFLSGIVVERSKLPGEGYTALDTIPATAASYLDTHVLPSTLYHYRFRMLSIRGSLSEPSAHVSHRMFAKRRAIETPERVRITRNDKGNTVISWSQVFSPEVSSYQVFRDLQGNTQLSPISNILQDTVFTDTTVSNSRIVYKYAVKTLNYENRSSEFSQVVFSSPGVVILPKTPYDVEAYAEPGKITLRWKDMVSYDPYIRGYTVYRKAIGIGAKPAESELSAQALLSDGFKKISGQLIQEVIFSDKTTMPGITYAYAVTATDQFGIEGNALGSKKLNSPRATLRAPEIYVRKITKGIEITWDDVLVSDVDKYLLFSRGSGQKDAVLIAEVQPGKEAFIISNIRAGQQFFYSMQISAKGIRSPAGIEKSIRID